MNNLALSISIEEPGVIKKLSHALKVLANRYPHCRDKFFIRNNADKFKAS